MNISKLRGNRLKQARLKAGLTQAELATHLSITDGAVSSYEQGDSLPRMKNALAIAKILNVSLDWLFLGAAMRDNGTQEFTEEEIELITNFRKAPKNLRKIILTLIKSLPQTYDRKRHLGGKDDE